MFRRGRRLRDTAIIRDLVRENELSVKDFILPIFVVEGENIKREISSLKGNYHWSVDRLGELVKELKETGVRSVIIFGVPEHKDCKGTEAYNENGIVQKAIRKLRELDDELYIITDVCMCEYTNHGHCGILHGKSIDNDETLEYLGKIALSHAKAGAHMIAPSDMMDGRVQAIRETLDEKGFYNVMIMSYSAKYASAFYEPFRVAACSSPHAGDRKSYQMDPANAVEAIRECELDVIEGCDFLMVKPALPYLDVVRMVRDEFMLPLVAYNVSGEYSMIMAAIEKGYLTERAIEESLISIKRAGADLIITNFAPYLLLNDVIE